MKNRLRQLRKENNLTVRELGEKVKIDYSTISRLETGKTIWNEDYLIALSDFFGVSMDYLLGKSDIRKPITDKMGILKEDEFQYALYEETKDLNDKKKREILRIIKALKDDDE